MKKRILAAALAAVMLSASATGCASGSAGSGDTIKIGGLAPLTGNVSVYGIATNNGAKLAVEAINKAGGINGKKV
ncbi:MAG TPA: ABC transporter substrate-binding protein, partial [Caproiciproducens sp.]|nr:ABC transporter substrate-binding protein [Caproiciproducens sp.]